jgi:hypothetical protein
MLSNKTMLEWFKTVRDPTLRTTLLRLETACRPGVRIRKFPRMLDALSDVYAQALGITDNERETLRVIYDRWTRSYQTFRRDTAPFCRTSIDPENMRNLKRYILKLDTALVLAILRDLEIDE